MATTNYRQQVTLNNIESKISTFDMSHDSITVTWTATMKNGSMLVAANTEAAAADAANVVKVIDDMSLVENDYAVGDTVAVTVASKGNVFNAGALTYSDTDVVDTSLLTSLEAQLNSFKTITNG